MNTTELKALAEKATGWKLDATMQTDDDRDEGIAFVGAINDEGIFSDVARIDTGLYYQPDKAIEVANFYAAANPAAILELIAAHEDAQGEIRALRATEAGLRERVKELDGKNKDCAQMLLINDRSEAIKWAKGMLLEIGGEVVVDHEFRALLEKKE